MSVVEMKEAVLVTGGAGYIGGQTVLSLLDKGFDVCVLDDLSTGTLRPFHSKTNFYEGRIQNADLVTEIIKKHSVRAILHFAGSIRVDESIENPLKYYDNNTDGSRILIDAAVTAGVERFIFSSTAAVYGTIDEGVAVTEDIPVSPLNPYGWSKLFTERLLRDVSLAHGLQYGIFRYFNVAGADPEMRHGQFLKDPVHLIGRAINAMRGKAPSLQVYGRDLPTHDGTGVRDYIHVCDLADAHVVLLENMYQHKDSMLLNLGYGKGSSVLDVIKVIDRISNKTVPYEFVDARKGEAPSVVADVSRVNECLDWTPKYNSLETIIGTSLQWMDVLD